MAEFEWDEDKRRANLSKHGIDFADVPPLFERPHLEDFDPRHSAGEDRWRVLGLVGDRVVFCVYTRRGGRRRLVTARPATRREAMLYYRECWFDPLG